LSSSSLQNSFNMELMQDTFASTKFKDAANNHLGDPNNIHSTHAIDRIPSFCFHSTAEM
jgi:hypothetical protein